MKFKELIEGRRVAIVGPAAYMQGLSYGSEIDDFDVVVRINRSVETTLKYPEDVGTRTDILYSCLIETAANGGKLDIKELTDLYKVKYICAPPYSNFSGVSASTRLHPMVNNSKVKEISEHIPVRIVGHKFHTDLAKKVNSRPNTGFMAIYDLLEQNPKELFVCGFSFYLDGFIPGCKSGIVEEKGVTEEEFGTMAFNSKRHNQKNMWSHAKETLRSHQSVTLDHKLFEILNLPSLDKDLFQGG